MSGADSGGAGGILPRDHAAPSVFLPENLLREARRQRGLEEAPVPRVCLLDPDGDIVAHLQRSGDGRRHPGWACYHTDMWTTRVGTEDDGADAGVEIGVVGAAVGAPFAVLVAEQLHASGARLVLSITSAGQITPLTEPPYFVFIESALRDEGTSGHYLPAADWSSAPAHLSAGVAAVRHMFAERVVPGTSWTTDAPYRETQGEIDAARASGIACVEMESAALYAYAEAQGRDVLCLAHVTNTMATEGDDFEKGEADGAIASLRLAAELARTARG